MYYIKISKYKNVGNIFEYMLKKVKIMLSLYSNNSKKHVILSYF